MMRLLEGMVLLQLTVWVVGALYVPSLCCCPKQQMHLMGCRPVPYALGLLS
jgi:hypothetical protein